MIVPDFNAALTGVTIAKAEIEMKTDTLIAPVLLQFSLNYRFQEDVEIHGDKKIFKEPINVK